MDVAAEDVKKSLAGAAAPIHRRQKQPPEKYADIIKHIKADIEEGISVETTASLIVASLQDDYGLSEEAASDVGLELYRKAQRTLTIPPKEKETC